MASPSTGVAPAGLGGPRLAAIERVAWRIPGSTRRLFVVLSATVAVATLVAAFVAALAVSSNSDTVRDARASGIGIAQAATDFRTQLAAADAQAAASLLSGGLEQPADRAVYDDAVLQASAALTSAAAVGRSEDTDDILQLSEQLVRFNGSIETSRANSRQGYPVGSAYLAQARELARVEMVPRADRLRREGERRVAQAANDVGGPVSATGVAAAVAAAGAVAGSALLVAGRTRRLLHPAITGAVVVSIVVVALVWTSVSDQRAALRAAAREDLLAFVASNQASSDLSSLRVTEIDAVAAHGSGDALFDQFQADATDLQARVADQGDDALGEGIRAYWGAVISVQAADDSGDNREAARLTLEGSSAEAFAQAQGLAAAGVRDQEALSERIGAADDASLDPAVLVGLGVLAAGLAVGGILSRAARRYR